MKEGGRMKGGCDDAKLSEEDLVFGAGRISCKKEETWRGE